MTVVVVDTNVAIAANGGKYAEGDIQCHLCCVERLESVVKQDTVAIDTTHLIMEEYGNNLSHAGGPGMGDAFFKHVFNYQYHGGRVRRIDVTRSDDDRKGFEELPDNQFDRSDRKFLAVALVAKAVVLNSTDGDWSENATLMKELGVSVEELCPHLPQIRSRGRVHQ
ncbi:MAG: hypothetical protein OXP28_03130 [Gammaproteobacteria bacterium]|nr:hypothetical protein [Gammaproteobacteria bacterium]MDE0224111.1 hypothetical protein [Gammaproteobacteria bacterium]